MTILNLDILREVVDDGGYESSSQLPQSELSQVDDTNYAEILVNDLEVGRYNYKSTTTFTLLNVELLNGKSFLLIEKDDNHNVLNEHFLSVGSVIINNDTGSLDNPPYIPKYINFKITDDAPPCEVPPHSENMRIMLQNYSTGELYYSDVDISGVALGDTIPLAINNMGVSNFMSAGNYGMRVRKLDIDTQSLRELEFDISVYADTFDITELGLGVQSELTKYHVYVSNPDNPYYSIRTDFGKSPNFSLSATSSAMLLLTKTHDGIIPECLLPEEQPDNLPDNTVYQPYIDDQTSIAGDDITEYPIDGENSDIVNDPELYTLTVDKPDAIQQKIDGCACALMLEYLTDVIDVRLHNIALETKTLRLQLAEFTQDTQNLDENVNKIAKSLYDDDGKLSSFIKLFKTSDIEDLEGSIANIIKQSFIDDTVELVDTMISSVKNMENTIIIDGDTFKIWSQGAEPVDVGGI